MNQDPCRKFWLSDAMILVAAMAVSFAISAQPARDYVNHLGRIIRYYDEIIASAPQGPNLNLFRSQKRAERNQDLFRATMRLNNMANVPFPFLLFSTPVVLWLRLRKPRPTWGELARQPGVVACIGGLFTVVLVILLDTCVGGYWPAISFAVVPVSWMLLVASGRWQSQPSWLDRAGRAVGIGWIASAAYAGLYVWFGPWW